MAEGDIVRRVTITATGEGIDSTTSSVESLSDAISKVGSNSDLSLSALVGLGAGAVGALATISGFVDYIAKANKELADMQTTAREAGLSVRDFQSVAFGGQVAGLSMDQVNSGLTKSAQLLNDAQRNANSLSKEFDANGLSIKGANGQLLTETQLLTTAGDLVRRAQNPQDQIAIAQMLGYTKEWIPFLEQAAHGFDGIRNAAEDAGVVVSEETIQKAAEFDERWRKSSTEFSMYMKAAFDEVLPYIDSAIEKAAKFIKSIDPAQIQKASDESFKQFEAATGIPADDGVITINTDKLEGAFKEWHDSPTFSRDTWKDFGRALWDGFSFQNGDSAAATIPGYASQRITEPTYPTAAQMDAAFDKANPPDPGSREHPLAGLSASDYESLTPSKVAAKDTGNNRDAIDRAEESLLKYVKTQQAAADSVGTTSDNIERLKAMAQLEAAAEKEGVSVTGERAKQFQELAQRAGDAALALEKAKVANQIDYSRQTSFLTPQDLQIATSLKNIYPDVTTALNSAEAAQMRMNNALKDFSNEARADITGFATDLTHAMQAGNSFWSSFQTAGVNALNKIADKLMSMAIDNVWSKAFGGTSGSSLFGLFGMGGSGPTMSGTGLGAGTGGLSFPMFADGTDSAPGGWSIVGEKGPELVNLPKGSQVLPNGMTPGGSVSAPVNVTIDARGADEAGMARVQQQIADLKASLPGTIVKTVTQAKKMRAL
jgi:protein-tyrosine-phosphatase